MRQKSDGSIQDPRIFPHCCQGRFSAYTKVGADGRVNVVDSLAEDWEDWKEHSDVKALPFGAVMEKCKAANDELAKFQTSIDNWTTTVSVAGKVKLFRDLHKNLSEQITEVSEYHTALDVLNNQEKGDRKVQKRRQREARNKLTQALVLGNVLTVVARVSYSHTVAQSSTVIQSYSRLQSLL